MRIFNEYSRRLSATIMFFSPETCGGEGGDFELMGWWNINPGGNALVYANDLADLNRFWYVHARAVDGRIWEGPFVYPTVPLEAFSRCWGIASSAGQSIPCGYREIDIGNHDNANVRIR